MNIENKTKFKVVTPEDGFVLTAFKDGDDITEYYSTTIVYAPLTKDIEFVEITLEKDAEYQAAKEAEIEARQKAAEEMEDATDEVTEE